MATATRDPWNAARYAPGMATGHYESWFQRANDPSGSRAFWIRYTIFAPRDRPADAVGELWAIVFERSETGGGDPDGLPGGAGGRALRGIELDSGTEPRSDRTRRRAARDADADDLHAAARGDADADDLHAAARGAPTPPDADDPPDRSPRKSSP
jgi:hypothetical protein